MLKYKIYQLMMLCHMNDIIFEKINLLWKISIWHLGIDQHFCCSVQRHWISFCLHQVVIYIEKTILDLKKKIINPYMKVQINSIALLIRGSIRHDKNENTWSQRLEFHLFHLVNWRIIWMSQIRLACYKEDTSTIVADFFI